VVILEVQFELLQGHYWHDNWAQVHQLHDGLPVALADQLQIPENVTVFLEVYAEQVKHSNHQDTHVSDEDTVVGGHVAGLNQEAMTLFFGNRAFSDLAQ